VFWGEGIWSWDAPGRIVNHISPQEFAEAMDVPNCDDNVVLQMRILNRLGADGWKLVAVKHENKHVLKRPG
jgi:hypothetical protein